MMMPDREDHHDEPMTRSTAHTIYEVGAWLGAAVGAVLLVLFVMDVAAGDDARWFFLVLGLVLLAFPLLLKRLLPRA